jgi:hypothetical protein
MTNNQKLLLILIFLASGLAFLGVAGWLYVQETRLTQEGITTDGIVIGLAESIDSENGSISYAPIVRFQTEGGRSFEFQSRYYTSPPAHEIGQNVTVLYPPENPREAVLKGASNLMIIIFAIVGGIDFLVGIFLGLKLLNSKIQEGY